MAKKKVNGATKNLMIVESPAKARTLEKFLDKNFVVKSSMGHIRDLPSKDFGIQMKKGGYTPQYVISPEKKDVQQLLSKLDQLSDEEVDLLLSRELFTNEVKQ